MLASLGLPSLHNKALSAKDYWSYPKVGPTILYLSARLVGSVLIQRMRTSCRSNSEVYISGFSASKVQALFGSKRTLRSSLQAGQGSLSFRGSSLYAAVHEIRTLSIH